MRNRYIVTYDICDPKRLAKIFKTMRGFGDHLQYSVFKCELSDCEKIMLLDILNDLIKHDEDRIMIVNLGISTGEKAQNIEFIGIKKNMEPVTIQII